MQNSVYKHHNSEVHNRIIEYSLECSLNLCHSLSLSLCCQNREVNGMKYMSINSVSCCSVHISFFASSNWLFSSNWCNFACFRRQHKNVFRYWGAKCLSNDSNIKYFRSYHKIYWWKLPCSSSSVKPLFFTWSCGKGSRKKEWILLIRFDASVKLKLANSESK